ncbi:unnamed protein product [Amoebophrya sp. A120]|nr:unnamed protein product [Amoebophrya sp. A120]|eukprot:GSA120T00010367001.1
MFTTYKRHGGFVAGLSTIMLLGTREPLFPGPDRGKLARKIPASARGKKERVSFSVACDLCSKYTML